MPHAISGDLRRRAAGAAMVVPSLSFLPLLLFFRLRFFHFGFDKRWQRRFLVVQLFDPQQGDTKQFLRLLQSFTQFLIFFPKVGRFFCCHCHGLSLPERSSLNSYVKHLIHYPIP